MNTEFVTGFGFVLMQNVVEWSMVGIFRWHRADSTLQRQSLNAPLSARDGMIGE
jgi:hypothetical protein